MANKKSKEKASSARNKYLLQMTRKGVFLAICLFFFISAWMFVLGVLVGRGTAPVQFDIEALQKELIALKESIIKQEQDRLRADTALTEKKQDLDFYEALKGSKQDDKLTFKPQEKQVVTTSEMAKKTQPEKTKKPTPTSMKKKTRSASTPAKGGAYSVQVASTKDAQAAQALVKKLQNRGYQAYVARAEISGKGTWHRVRVGRGSSKEGAEHLRGQLMKDGYNGMVIKN